MEITKLSLKRPVSVLLMVVLIAVFGFSALPNFRMAYMPSLSLPMYIVTTIYPGASAELIDKEITNDVTEVGKNITGFTESQIISRDNVSIVMLKFSYETDMNQCYIDLKAGLDRLQLPDDAETPIIIQMTGLDATVVDISVRSLSGADELVFVNDILEPRISSVLGVGEVNIYGGEEQFVEILLNEPALNQHGLSSFSVASAIQSANYTLPLGDVFQANQAISVVATSEPQTLYDLMQIPITTPYGNTILVQDVATVNFSLAEFETISRYNGEKNVILNIQGTQDADVPSVANQIVAIIKELSILYPDMEIEVVSNTADGIYESLSSVASTLVLGVLLCMFVLLIFLGDYKASLIVASSIPTSLLITILGMNALNLDLDLITTSALVISIGLMVDNSIVILESIFKCKTDENSFFDAAVEGVKTVSASVMASTVTTIVVYVPLVGLSGLSGELFTSLGYTIIFALMASFVVAVTVVPLVYYKLEPIEKTKSPMNPIMKVLEAGYDKLIRKILKLKFLALLIAVGLLVATGYIITTIPIEMMPSVDQGIVDINIEFRQGTDIEFVNDAILDIEQKILNDEQFESFTIILEDNTAAFKCFVADEVNTELLAIEYDKYLRNLTNMDINVSTRNIDGSSVEMPNASISVYGVDFDSVKEEAIRIQEEMYNILGVTRVTSTMGAGGSQAKIEIDPLKTAHYGMQVGSVAQIIYSVNNGIDVGTLGIRGNEYDIIVNYPDGYYDDFNKLMAMPIDTPQGKIVLSDIAELVFDEVEQSLSAVDGSYYIDLKAYTEEQYLPYVKSEVQTIMDEMPDGIVYVTSALIADPLEAEMPVIISAVMTGIFMVFMVMAMQFESIRYSLMVMTSVIFSFIGSFGLLAISGQDLTLVSLVGLLMLTGIVVNNGILFVDTANMLKQEMPLEEALVISGRMRMRPILMTTATTILSMLPLALGIGEGSQLLQGMGIIIVGGLLTSTLLVLILLPTFYLIISKDVSPKKEATIIQTPQAS
ncbi:MAG: hypothetical protein ATN36_00065 [Epulopiscium sp. Nele67-Bin005]|nr:MAG: hypothetical protein ATN36_00065 [Epulopiscium sp. Nele67-Bin005]